MIVSDRHLSVVFSVFTLAGAFDADSGIGM